MPNKRLQRAMVSARLGVDQLAEQTGVDPKTVQRWVQGRSPHPRHRWAVAVALGADQEYLWPDRQPTAGNRVAEVLTAFRHREDMEVDQWWELFLGARRGIDLLGYALLFLPEQHPGLNDLLRAKAREGCRVRIALARPDGSAAAQRDQEGLGGALDARIRTTVARFLPLQRGAGVELRLHDTPMYNSIFRFDDDILVTPHLHGVPGHRSPLLHIRRLPGDSLYEAFASNFDAIWSLATPVREPRASNRRGRDQGQLDLIADR